MRINKEEIYITKDKNSEILQNTKDKIHELNTPDKQSKYKSIEAFLSCKRD